MEIKEHHGYSPPLGVNKSKIYPEWKVNAAAGLWEAAEFIDSVTFGSIHEQTLGGAGAVAQLVADISLSVKMVEAPFDVFEENPSMRRSPAVRVEDMFEQVKTKLPGAPKFLLCVLTEKKEF